MRRISREPREERHRLRRRPVRNDLRDETADVRVVFDDEDDFAWHYNVDILVRGAKNNRPS